MNDALEWLRAQAGPAGVQMHADTRWGLTSHLARGRIGTRFAGAVSGDADAGTQVNALLDLLAWTEAANEPQAPITLAVGYGSKLPAVRGALQTLRGTLRSRRDVQLLVQTIPDGPFEEDHGLPYKFAGHPVAVRYAKLLESWADMPVTGVVADLLEAVQDDRLRLHPQLSKPAQQTTAWSVRLEGLQVGLVGANGGWLDVGKSSTTNKDSIARSKWHAAGAPSDRVKVNDSSVRQAADLIRAFADRLETRATPGLAKKLLDHGQPEHALEAAVLRGAVPVHVDGTPLQVPHRHPQVIRDSQVPTRWAERATAARYIDALMAQGTTPWILELKVPAAAGGYGAYLRKAISQAVLYRHFIRTAEPMHPWLRAGGLDPTTAKAAIVYPEVLDDNVAAKIRPRLHRHTKVAEELDVAVLDVPAGPTTT
jgi:hypothetical protein